jgi:CMP-N-acetylneuraminic acid synthetase
MKVVALIPFWSDYQSSVSGKGCRPLIKIGGKTLINRTVEIINRINSIEEVVIFASNDKVLDFFDDNVRYKFLNRDEYLDSDKISIEDIINDFLRESDADIVVLMHPKSPFIKPKTIQECIEKVVSGKFDSAFVASSIRKHAWYQGSPLNYSKFKDTPALSKIDPILVETCSVYVFTRKMFENSRHRISENPYVKEVGHFEGFEVDRKDDLKMAELIINSGLDKEF